MSEPIIKDITSELSNSSISKDIDDVIKNNIEKFKFSNETLVSAAKSADIEYEPNANLESSNNNQLSTQPQEDSEEVLKTTLTDLLSIYKDNYGVTVAYDGLDEALKTTLASSKSAREINKLVQGDITSTMSDLLIFKAIIVIGKVIDSQLNGILNKEYTDSLSGETVSIINQMMGWIKYLEDIKLKYSQFDISHKIKELTNTKSDVVKRTELEKRLIDILRNGLDNKLKS
jgi:hypothetical protein